MNRIMAKWTDRALRVYCRRSPVLRGKMRLVRILSPWIHAPGEVRVARSKYGYSMRCSMGDWIQWQIYYLGDYVGEARYARYLMSEVRPGDAFIDIGANIGYYTLLASRLVGGEGRVFAFEAHEPAFQRLEQNLRLNSAANVVVLPIAASDAPGQIGLEAPAPGNLGGTRVVDAVLPDSTTVRMDTVDDALAGEDLSRLRFVKIDVEGFEVRVLKGCLRTLEEYHPTCLVEVRRAQLATYDTNPEELHRILNGLGYRAYAVTGRGGLEEVGPDREASLIVFKAAGRGRS